ncbi:MAG: methyltransferase, partial [Candidatus Bathyarchaeia archaeon]
MAQEKGFDLLKEKVPEFRSPLKMAGIVAIGLLVFLGIMTFFWWFDGLVWYGALISQLILALVCSAFSYGHMKNAEKYRKKYGKLAYRYLFFRFIILMLVTGNACIFHPLIVEGPALLLFWLAIGFGTFLIFMRFLLEWHIHRSGFDEVGHGLGIYMVFPEEGGRLSSDIYSYIRHPMFAGDLCLALGFALLRNNLLAVFAALISFIPFLVEVRLEDEE